MARRQTRWDRGYYEPPEGRYRPTPDRDMESVIKELVAEAVDGATAPLVAQLKTLTARNEVLEARVASLEQRPAEEEVTEKTLDALEDMERSAADTDNNLRRSSVVVTGLRADNDGVESAAIDLFGRMGVTVGPSDVNSARHLSTKDNAAVIVKFAKQKHAEAVLKAGRGFAGAKVKPDYCVHTRRARGFLFGTLLRLKADGSGTTPPKLMGSRIVHGDSTYRWHARREAVELIRPGQSSSYSPLEPVPVDTQATASVSAPTSPPRVSNIPLQPTLRPLPGLRQEAAATPSPKRRREPEGHSPKNDSKRLHPDVRASLREWLGSTSGMLEKIDESLPDARE